jgi:hypothetical protein
MTDKFNEATQKTSHVLCHTNKTEQKEIKGSSVPKGGTMTLQVEMISGTTFKILGIMICKY